MAWPLPAPCAKRQVTGLGAAVGCVSLTEDGPAKGSVQVPIGGANSSAACCEHRVRGSRPLRRPAPVLLHPISPIQGTPAPKRRSSSRSKRLGSTSYPGTSCGATDCTPVGRARIIHVRVDDLRRREPERPASTAGLAVEEPYDIQVASVVIRGYCRPGRGGIGKRTRRPDSPDRFPDHVLPTGAALHSSLWDGRGSGSGR
jgi:hypothetical protein